MKKNALLILAIVVLTAGTSLGAKVVYRLFTPSGAGKSVFLKSGDKKHKYFLVEKGNTLGFDVVGPTTVKVRTRAELRSGVTADNYEIQIWEGDRLIEGRKAKTAPSKLILEGQDGAVGLSRTVIVKVPRGKHSYRLWLASDNIDKFYARFYQVKKPVKKTGYIPYKPLDIKKEIHLSSGKTQTTYYLVDADGGAVVTIIGPTRLRIYCRANFDQEMKGSAKFSFGIFEKNLEVTQFSAVAKMASNVIFKELNDMVPSVLNTFNFDVPPGKHAYEFRKINSASPSLALRFKIRKDGLAKKL